MNQPKSTHQYSSGSALSPHVSNIRFRTPLSSWTYCHCLRNRHKQKLHNVLPSGCSNTYKRKSHKGPRRQISCTRLFVWSDRTVARIALHWRNGFRCLRTLCSWTRRTSGWRRRSSMLGLNRYRDLRQRVQSKRRLRLTAVVAEAADMVLKFLAKIITDFF